MFILGLVLSHALADDPPVSRPPGKLDANKLYLRVHVRQPTEREGLRLAPKVYPTRGRPITMPPLEVEPDGWTGYFELPLLPQTFGTGDEQRILRDRNLYEAVGLAVLGPGEQTPGAIELEAVFLTKPGGEPIRSMSRSAQGYVLTIILPDGPVDSAAGRAHWLDEHVADLEKALDEAGIGRDGPTFRVFQAVTKLNTRRFREPNLTYDPALIERTARLLRRIGFNVVTPNAYKVEPTLFKGWQRTYNRAIAEKELYRPADADMRQTVREYYRELQDSDLFIAAGQPPLLMKLGDEHNPMPSTRLDTPRGRAILIAQAQAVLGDDPRALGVESWQQLLPFDYKPNVAENPAADRLRAYITARARNVASAEAMAVQTAAIHDAISTDTQTFTTMLGALYYGGFSKWFSWWRTPDYFRWADAHATDIVQIEGMTPYYPPGGPLAELLIQPALSAQAARRNENVSPGIMIFPQRCEPEAFHLGVMTGLSEGIEHIHFYRFGFQATGWEYFDSPDKIVPLARLTRWMARVEPHLAGCSAPEPKIGLLMTESSDMWQSDPQSFSKCELAGTFYALRLAGHGTDFVREFMVEQGELERYKVLYVSQRNVSRRVQKRILDWVRSGGTLWLTPGAMTRDEADRPCDLLDDALGKAVQWLAARDQPLAGGHFTVYPAASTVRFPERGIGPIQASFWTQPVGGSSPVVATYADGQAAARRVELGKGRLYALGFLPGYAFCSGADRRRRVETVDVTQRTDDREEEIIGSTRTGAPYWFAPHAEAQQAIVLPLHAAGIHPAVSTGRADVLASLRMKSGRAVVLLTSFHPDPQGSLTLRIRLPHAPLGVRHLDGKPIEHRWSAREQAVILTVSHVPMQALLLDLPE